MLSLTSLYLALFFKVSNVNKFYSLNLSTVFRVRPYGRFMENDLNVKKERIFTEQIKNPIL